MLARRELDTVALPDELIGTWISDPADHDGLDYFGNVSLEFDSDGSLTYTIHAENKDQKMFLSYQVEKGMLITTQPSAPREERTAYSIDREGKLTLLFEGRRAVYVRSG